MTWSSGEYQLCLMLHWLFLESSDHAQLQWVMNVIVVVKLDSKLAMLK